MGYEYQVYGNLGEIGETFSKLEYAIEDMEWYQERHPNDKFYIKRRRVGDWEVFNNE